MDMLLGFPEYRKQAMALAGAAGLAYADVHLHRFPDGESRVRLPPVLSRRAILCRSLDHPNDKLVELLLAAGEARNLGVDSLTLVAPYLAYMRQDCSFHPGEAISQQVVGHLLAGYFDGLVSVDPHLHRVHTLEQAVPTGHSVSLLASGPVGDFLAREQPGALVVGPDAESGQWVSAVAARSGCDFVVGRKTRHGDREVEIALEGNFRGRDVVLVDDVASTGHTLMAAADIIRPQQPASVSVVVTHALFAGDAFERLRSAGFAHIWSTDSIPHASNAIPLAPLLSAQLRSEL